MATLPRNRNKAKQAQQSTTATKVGLYLRVSTERQVTDGNGIDAQRSALLARCNKEGWTHITEYVDAGISGKSTEGRDEFNRMIADAQAGAIQIVMVKTLDRIARNTADFLKTADTLDKAGCRLLMLDPETDLKTGMGRLLATLYAAFAELERGLITQRVMGGKGEQATQGQFNGSPIAYGYTRDETVIDAPWTIVDDEAKIVRRIFSEFNDGKTFNAIAQGLNADGIKTPRGKDEWRHPQVKHIVRNGSYAGLRQWNSVTTPAPTKTVKGTNEETGEETVTIVPTLPAIINKDVWDAAEARQTQRGNPNFGKAAAVDPEDAAYGLDGNPDHVEVVRKLFADFANPYKRPTLNEIADDLNTDEIPTRRPGGKWTASTLNYLLRNPAYVPDVVDTDTFARAQRRLQALRPGPAR